MRVYLDTSVVNAFLFGKIKEKARHLYCCKIFEIIDSGKITGIISFYTLHEKINRQRTVATAASHPLQMG